MKNLCHEDTAIQQTQEVTHKAILLAKEIIGVYNRFLSGEIGTEELFCGLIENSLDELSKILDIGMNLPFGPSHVNEWQNACIGLISTIHNFMFYYRKEYLSGRTPDNRRQCMDMTIRQFYEELDRVAELSNAIEAIN